MLSLCLLLTAFAGEPTELENERQKLIDMGIDPAVLDELEKSVEQTMAIVEGIEEINSRLSLLRDAVAKRTEIEACQVQAVERAKAPIAGSLVFSIEVTAEGTIGSITESRRDPSVDPELSACASAVVEGLTLPKEDVAQTLDLELVFPDSAE